MNKVYPGQSITSLLSDNKSYFLLFLIWPFLAFMTALANFERKNAKRVVYLFLIYYGLTFVIANEGVDSFRIALKLGQYAGMTFSEFWIRLGGLFSNDDTMDVYDLLMSFFVSRFTVHHGLLFAAYAAVFGFFYLKSISLLFNARSDKLDLNLLIVLFFFAMIVPVTAINGVRFYTAVWIFFYGAFHVILNRDLRYLALALSASLVHFSFLTANFVLIVYFFLGNRNLIYFPLAISSFIIPQFISPFLQTLSLRLGGAFQSRYDMYASEYTILARAEASTKAAWFMQVSDDLIYYFLIFSLIVIRIFFKKLMKDNLTQNVFSFTLLFLTFVNFTMGIPSFGGRFQSIFFLFATVYIFHFLNKFSGKKLHLLTLLGLFPMFLLIAIRLRQGADSINAWILAPGFGLPLFVPDLSLAEAFFQ